MNIEIIDHSVCSVVLDIKSKGLVLMDRMTYTIRGQQSVRHIMETGSPGISIIGTLMQGVRNEAVIDPHTRPRILSPKPIYIEFGPSQLDPSKAHLKVIFPIALPADALRKIPRQDGDAIIGAVDMWEARNLIKHTKDTVPFHLTASYAGLAFAAEDDRDVAHRYSDLLAEWDPQPLSEEQIDAILVYQHKWPKASRSHFDLMMA